MVLATRAFWDNEIWKKNSAKTKDWGLADCYRIQWHLSENELFFKVWNIPPFLSLLWFPLILSHQSFNNIYFFVLFRFSRSLSIKRPKSPNHFFFFSSITMVLFSLFPFSPISVFHHLLLVLLLLFILLSLLCPIYFARIQCWNIWSLFYIGKHSFSVDPPAWSPFALLCCPPSCTQACMVPLFLLQLLQRRKCLGASRPKVLGSASASALSPCSLMWWICAHGRLLMDLNCFSACYLKSFPQPPILGSAQPEMQKHLCACLTYHVYSATKHWKVRKQGKLNLFYLNRG